MQFLWKYVDDLVGKGLEWYVIIELLVYASASLVPLALPLAILLSSLMSFGNLGEHYELVACRSAGISLQRVMSPLIIFSVLVSVGAFYFSNDVLPFANLKMGSLLYDVRQQKPAFSLKEGVFYNGIDGYSIKVGKKDNDKQTLHNIMIYDHTMGIGNNKVITAASGKMAMSDDERFLILTLFNGYTFEEMQSQKQMNDNHPFLRTEFKEEIVRFDLSGFKFTRTDEDLFKDNYQMLNLAQLVAAEDTLKMKMEERKKDFRMGFASSFIFQKDSILNVSPSSHLANSWKNNFLSEFNFAKNNQSKIIEAASNLARSAEMRISNALEDIDMREKTIIRHEIEWHRKFTFSFACFVLFFIGAPLGAIIRKGGLGMPMILSTIFFVLFYLMSITGEKFAKEGLISPQLGMWIASIVLFPFGVFLTMKATRDSALFDIDAYLGSFRRFFKKG